MKFSHEKINDLSIKSKLTGIADCVTISESSKADLIEGNMNVRRGSVFIFAVPNTRPSSTIQKVSATPVAHISISGGELSRTALS